MVLELPIADGETPYMHQFANTPNYLVFMLFPLYWDIMGVAASTTILPNMKWRAGNGTKVIVISKKTWNVVRTMWYKEAVFAYHYVNAFEEAGDVLMDILLVPCGGSKAMPLSSALPPLLTRSQSAHFHCARTHQHPSPPTHTHTPHDAPHVGVASHPTNELAHRTNDVSCRCHRVPRNALT